MISILLAVTCPIPALSYPSSTASLRLSISASPVQQRHHQRPLPCPHPVFSRPATLYPNPALSAKPPLPHQDLSRPAAPPCLCVLMLSSTTVSPSSSLSLSGQSSSSSQVHICIAVATFWCQQFHLFCTSVIYFFSLCGNYFFL